MENKNKKQKSKIDYMSILKEEGLHIAGGLVGNQVTTLLEKQSFMVDNEKFAPLVTVVLGVAGRIFMPSLKDAFNGVVTVAGVEYAESLINDTMSDKPAIKGLPMGYVPRAMPNDPEIVSSNGVVAK